MLEAIQVLYTFLYQKPDGRNAYIQHDAGPYSQWPITVDEWNDAYAGAFREAGSPPLGLTLISALPLRVPANVRVVG